MPFHRGSRRARRLIGGMLGVLVTVSLVAVAGPSRADDDYPYRGLGQCPLVPLPPHSHGKPGKPGGHTKPGDHTRPGHGTHGKPDSPTKPAPPRECAKHIWYYNGTYGDPWGFALRNCTSFVAWRLRETNGISDFSNNLGGGRFGNAENWDDDAEALGYLVDDVPAVGAVAQTDDGRVGHVAWVSAVGDGTVTVEEYNYLVAGGFDVRTVPTSDFRYLHLADVAPDPSLGSTRAAATTAAPGGGTWTARTTGHGDLTVTTTSGRPTRLGSHVVLSSDAAPSIAADTLGRTWVAAVSADGRVFTAHTRGATDRWTRLRAVKGGPWSTTSTPTLALDGHGRMQLLTISAAGDLVSRHTTVSNDRWGRRDRMGAPGSWSTHAAPAAATDARGNLWVTAVTRHGTLEAVHTQDHGRPWSRFHTVDRRTWSVTSSPALTLAGDGRLWLTGVTARGELVSRHTGAGTAHWSHGVQAAGQWSPYSSPATTVDVSGRLWLAAVRTDGRAVVDSTTPGSGQWRSPRALGPQLPVTTSTSLIAPERGGVRVGVATSHGRPVWRRAGNALPLSVAGFGPRAGSFESPLVLAIHP
jgi:surface antigen